MDGIFIEIESGKLKAVDLEDLGPGLCVVTTLVLVASTLSMAARVQARYNQKAKFLVDDFFAPVAYVALLANIIANYIVVQAQYYKPTLPDEQGRQRGDEALRTVGFTYGISVTASKLSLLFLIRRIFWSKGSKWFQTFWWLALVTIFPTFFALSMYAGYASVMLVTTGYVYAGVIMLSYFNVATDIAILALPIRAIFRLEYGLKKRLQIVALFALGSLGIAVSVIRLASSYKMDSEYRSGAVTDLELSRAYSGKLNRAQSYKHLVLGVAEAGVIFICACLPICRQVFGNIRSAIVPSFLSSRKALSKINESDHKGLESSDSLEKQSTRRISRPHV